MKRIICLSGNAGFGDVVAEMLQVELQSNGHRVLIAHFEAPLKRLCKDWFGWDGKNDSAGRALLQCIDNSVRIEMPDFWVDHTMSLISAMRDEWDYVIIPDCCENKLDMTRYEFEILHIQINDMIKEKKSNENIIIC